jgi:hypothetical protein
MDGVEEKVSVSSDGSASYLGGILSGMVSPEDLEGIMRYQASILEDLQTGSQMLHTCCDYGERNYQILGQSLKQHTKLLKQLRKDLNAAFRRIRHLKSIVESLE